MSDFLLSVDCCLPQTRHTDFDCGLFCLSDFAFEVGHVVGVTG